MRAFLTCFNSVLHLYVCSVFLFVSFVVVVVIVVLAVVVLAVVVLAVVDCFNIEDVHTMPL